MTDQATKDAPNDVSHRPAVAGQVGRSVRPHAAVDLLGDPVEEPMTAMYAGDGEQRIFTPDDLARDIVAHFRPSGRMLEPCKGAGAFVRAMPGCDWFEVSEGTDFLKATGHWDWIVTNPPWRDVAEFLEKSMQCADNIVFLCWASAWWTNHRQRLLKKHGFGIAEIRWVPTPPPPWPQSGFLLTATWLRKGWTGGIAFSVA